jgi:hypothetical protein
VDEKREVARLDGQHLADPANTVGLAPDEGVERRVEGLERVDAGRERRLDARTRKPARETTRRDLDLG